MPGLPSPEISWRADGSPESDRFGDIYYSSEDGLAETRHVFLDGNRLPATWAERNRFTIGETGFGTGLNFLATWERWRATRRPDQRLDFISVEGFPLSREDLARALTQWPELAPLADTLLAHYPAPHRGTQLLALPDNVTLTLLEDDALAALQGLDASVDAWFLDGFAPAGNPDMWSDALFGEIARLSAPGTTLATFTVAGSVRRGLAAQGFELAKVPGFGRKREMLTGTLPQKETRAHARPWYQIPVVRAPSSATIVGAGIAGASAAAALTRQGINTRLIDMEGPGAGASGNPAALFMPRIAADESAEGRFHIAAYLHMERWLALLPEEARAQIFRPCGVLQVARTDEEARRFETIVERELLPPGHVELIGAHALHALAGFMTGLPALLFPKSGVVTPDALLSLLMSGMDVQTASVRTLARRHDVWDMHGADGAPPAETEVLVLANGAGLAAFEETRWLPLEAVRGQLSELPDGVLPPQRHALVAGPYLISHADGTALTGATYEPVKPGDLSLAPSIDRHRRNLDMLGTVFPSFQSALAALAPETLGGRAAFRAQVPDRVPVAGPAPDHAAYLDAYARLRHGDRFADYPPAPCHEGLFLFGGLGARGFSTSLLLGEYLAAQIAGAPLPLPRDVAEAVHPARFIVRALRKNTP